jgi:starch synthase
VVHCHDWQAALVPLLIRLDEQANHTRIATKTMFTIHNMAYQGIFWSLDFPMTNLPWQFFTPDGIEFYGQMNLMKAGIVFSDLLTTVSPRYAQEIQTVECGFGLENAVRARADRLRGILNGVDTAEWNPETDRYIARHFSAGDLQGKAECKAELLKRFHLDGGNEAPVIGVISRLTEQKGCDIIEEVLERLLKLPVRITALVRGESRYEKFWQDAAKRYAKQVACRVAYDESLAHQIEAGADLFLIPSKFEPCGLNQMYSLRYGAVPIVRATGGLDDTIQQFDPQTGQGNGFKFEEYSGAALLAKCEESMRVYEDKPLWQRLQQNAMACDFSWSQSASRYLELYEKG